MYIKYTLLTNWHLEFRIWWRSETIVVFFYSYLRFMEWLRRKLMFVANLRVLFKSTCTLGSQSLLTPSAVLGVNSLQPLENVLHHLVCIGCLSFFCKVKKDICNKLDMEFLEFFASHKRFSSNGFKEELLLLRI